MHHLDCTGGRQRAPSSTACIHTCSQTQQGAQPLSAAKQCVGHGINEPPARQLRYLRFKRAAHLLSELLQGG